MTNPLPYNPGGRVSKSAPPGWPRSCRCSKSAGSNSSNRAAGNFNLPAYPGLIVKDSYWRWPERDLAGNAIDFFMHVLGLSFHDAMRQITGAQ